MRISWRSIWNTAVYVFAAIGFIFVAVFFAIRFHLTDVAGKVDERSAAFESMSQKAKVLGVASQSQQSPQGKNLLSLDTAIKDLSKQQQIQRENVCALRQLKGYSPADAERIWKAFAYPDVIVWKMLAAAKDNLPDAGGFDTQVAQCARDAVMGDEAAFVGGFGDSGDTRSVFAWSNDDEWRSLEQAAAKDKDVIDRVSEETGVESRLIVSNLVVEQTRLFHSEREIFKRYFEPLKILGNSTVISLGVLGIKPTTAEVVEQHLKDTGSPYYLGPAYEHALDYPEGADPGKERYNRLTDDKNRYYIYLYGALYLKQMLHQWQAAGYDIQHRPEIIGTLFNVGFPQSHPNDHPKVGGSVIHVGDHEYSFGRLAYEFYYSGFLLDEFPYALD